MTIQIIHVVSVVRMSVQIHVSAPDAKPANAATVMSGIQPTRRDTVLTAGTRKIEDLIC